MNRSLRLLGLSFVLAAAPAVADIHPNLQRGLVPGKSVQAGEIDHVNQFNGNLTLTIPIGSGYPVGGNLGYGLGLVWSGQPWNHFENGGVWQSTPNLRSNAGFGWSLSLGRLESTLLPTNDSGSWLYVSPNGSEHKFDVRLHDGETYTAGVWYTRDGSYLRMKELGGGLAEVEFPDGAIHRFTTATGELQQMRDRFGNTATVTTLAGGSWYLSDSTGRSQSIQVNFTADAVLGKRATSVVVKTVGGGTATYSLGYTSTTLDRPCIDTDPGTGLLTVNLLTSVSLPDGSSYQMPEYHVDQTAGCVTPGAIKSVVLPTLGKIGWTYLEYAYPAAGEKFSRTRSNGLASRTTYNAAGASLGQWTYTTALDATPARQMLNTVTTPLGHKTEHYFSVSRTEDATAGWTKYEYGLPLTRHQPDATGTRFLSSRVYNSAGTLLRSSYVAYQKDPDLAGYPLPEATKLNQRLFTARTVFHDDGDRYADVTHSEFDGLGHYRYTSIGGNFDAGNARTTYRQHNPGNGTFPGSFAMWPTASPWVLHTVGFEWEAENGVTAVRSYAVDGNTGWVLRTRVHRLDNGGESTTDLVIETAHDGSGNLATERYYGGDVQAVPTGNLHSITLPQPPQYRIDHTTQYGTRATSRYIQANGTAMSFLSLDQSIDPFTGAVTVSRDTATLATSYEYDVLGRVRWVKPATGQDGWTEMVYTRATSAAALAKVNVYHRPNGGGTALAESATLFDAFGRPWQEQQKMPNGTFSTRETLYNAVGWRSSVSEQGNTAKRTQFLSYDPFGRPGTIRPPDGTAHDVTLSYNGTRVVERAANVATSPTGYTTAWTKELYDRQGRLYRAREDANPSAATPTTTTNYYYDVGHRLVRVHQTTDAGVQNRYFTYDRRGFLLSEQHPEKGVSGNGSVSYQWYDALGLPGRKLDGPSDLRFTYDRAGRVARVDGQIATPAAFAGLRPIKVFTYGSSNLATNRSNGKLEQATRYNYVDLPFNAEVRVVDTYTFGGRQGRVSTKNTRMVFNGGNSEAFSQSYTYDALGNVTRLDYPDCTAVCGPSSPRAVFPTYTNGWLSAVPGYASSISYHTNGLYNQITHVNGVVDTQTNDPNHMARPRELFSQRSGVDVWRSGLYQYDGAGNVKKIGNGFYLYDKVSRLVQGEVYDGPTGAGTKWTQTYAYDGFGNLNAITPGIGTGSTTTAATNRVTSASYDAAGNMTGFGGNTHEYDAMGMMTRAIVSGADWRYMYTADDERFWTYGPGKSTWALRDLGGSVLREYDAHLGWGTFRDYVYRGGQLLASVYPGEGQRQFHLDHLGTPRAITNSAGTRLAFHAYFPYGEELTGVAQDTEQMKFTGHERDLQGTASVADDLDYMHARFYNPQLGRFLSFDPVGGNPSAPQSWNRYAYVLGNPMKYIDPLVPCNR